MTVGLLGAATALLDGFLLRAILRSPGDDNAIGFLFLFGALASAIPLVGLVWRPPRINAVVVAWLVVSAGIVAIFGVVVFVMFGSAL